MYAVEQIKEYLKPAGWMTTTNLKKEIASIAEHVTEDEIVENAGVGVRGRLALKEYLIVLTSDRILTVDKQKKVLSYNCSQILKPEVINKMGSIDVKFLYGDEEVLFNITLNDFGKSFSKTLQEKIGISPEIKEIEETDSRKVVRVMKTIKMNIDILTGKEQLKHNGFGYKLVQNKAGTVEISVDYHDAETFKLVKWERVVNVQKSASSIVGWTVIGSKFGNAGAIAGAMGANIGKDKSVATLFLKRENGEKVPLVIKCDKKDLEKLSLLILAEEEETKQAAPPSTPSSIPTDELIKLKELMDAGILTQEEFDAKKKQLLGI